MKDYFESLFTSECNGLFGNIIDKIPRCISSDMNVMLDSPVEGKEIIDAFRQMDPKKTLGIDGLSGLVNKEHWMCFVFVKKF